MRLTPANAPDFIAANTRLQAVPHAPEISLWLADEITPLWRLTEEELGAIGLPPPFWAFAWAGGQGLARHLLDHPDLVSGRSVLDFASGSGLVGIAARMAGASAVLAADIDPWSETAIRLNAALNGVSLDYTVKNMVGRDEGWDVVLAGDVFYERAFADVLIPWFSALAARGATVLIGDPGRAYCPRERMEELATYTVPVTRALEDSEVKRTTVWRFIGSAG